MAAYTRNQNWRSRGATPGGYRGGRRPTTTKPPSSAFVFKDLEECVTTLSADASGSYGTSELVRLRHVKPVASYSWIDAPVPTIVVPGSPWIWADERPAVRRVPLDAGVQQIHHDAAKMGDRSPMLPLFAAVDALHPDFAYVDLDLVTDRNGLRKLLRYVDGVRAEEDFRIDVDLAGKTCLFTRREEEAVLMGQNTGYGHEYVKAATKVPKGCERMSDHHRIVTYKFGSLNILLGFTADACLEQRQTKADDDLLASFSSLSIGNKADEAIRSDTSSKVEEVIKLREPSKAVPVANVDTPSKLSLVGLEVRLSPSRALVPQSNLIEIKTRSTYRDPNWRDIYPQLYLSQTAWLYMARHTSGEFEPVEKFSLTGEAMKPYAEMMEGSLGKLKNLLKDILKAVREQGEGVPLSLVRQGGTLSLWRRKPGSGKVLGEEIMSRFKKA